MIVVTKEVQVIVVHLGSRIGCEMFVRVQHRRGYIYFFTRNFEILGGYSAIFKETAMTKHTEIKQHSYWIPKNYYKPAMFALEHFCKYRRFNQAVDAAYYIFTDPSSEDYVEPSKLNRNNLAKHLLKYISNL